MAKLGKTINNVIRGDSRNVRVSVLEADASTPTDLSGGTLYFTVSASDDPSSDASALIQKIITNFDNPTSGIQVVALGHSDTDIIPATYWYDSQFVDSLGDYVSSYRGKFIVQSDTTRS